MDKKYFPDVLISFIITIITIWVILLLSYDSGLAGLGHAALIIFGIPSIGIALLILKFIKLRKVSIVSFFTSSRSSFTVRGINI